MLAGQSPDLGATLARLEAKLDRLSDELEKTNVELMNMRERVYGNGKPGLIADVSEARNLAQQALNAISSRDRLLGTVGGILLSLFVGMLWSIFTGQWKIVIP